MSKKKIHLRIVTLMGIKVDQTADMVIVRCRNGDMGFLPDHAAYSVVLGHGVLRILNGGAERRLTIYGGIAEIQDNVLTILTNDVH